MRHRRLSRAQAKMLDRVVDRHERHGYASTVKDDDRDTARELVHAGLAAWHPPLSPIAAVLARGLAPRVSELVASRNRIVPTALGRARVTERNERQDAAKRRRTRQEKQH